jgi:hypothetical protein
MLLADVCNAGKSRLVFVLITATLDGWEAFLRQSFGPSSSLSAPAGTKPFRQVRLLSVVVGKSVPKFIAPVGLQSTVSIDTETASPLLRLSTI